ncbi:hypothetical protein DNTS_004039 [Danionella cerebrum]|uniref:SV2A/B/C luminal domain-containing protein n=1 Tax=Danionella cerebrum TaxID=2873325 RepID=A0A553RIE1_9TELE|nr:hypothetical protein DNTS_004039 [Danionella translucida]
MLESIVGHIETVLVVARGSFSELRLLLRVNEGVSHQESLPVPSLSLCTEMEDPYRDRSSLAKGARDIAKEAKRHAVKKVTKAVDRASDEYSSRNYSRFENDAGDDDDYYHQDGDAHRERNHHEDDEGSSDATEGHDDEDEIYEGEYQGVPAAGVGADANGGRGPVLTDSLKDQRELEKEREADEEELAQQYELIMQECGHGRFQWQLFFVLGLALMSDGVEVFVVGFVLPSAETDMCVPNSGAGWLGSVVYLGMLAGAFLWGGLSDRLGRRQCLLVALSLRVQHLPLLQDARRIRFLSREKRGEHLSWLCMFWMVGGIYASAMAWAIIPHYGWSFSMGSAYQFHSWRVFVVVCTFPCVSAVVALTFMPESPRFYLQVNRIKIPKQLDELVEMKSESSNPAVKVLFRIRSELHAIWKTFLKCWENPIKDNTMRLAVVWFSLSFGYYGLSVWFPDVIKHLQENEYASRVKIHTNEKIEDFTFNFTLENQIHKNGAFINDSCVCPDLTRSCQGLYDSAEHSPAAETAEAHGKCNIDDSKFLGSSVVNSSFAHNKTGCQMSFDDDYSAYWVYFINFLGTLAVLPGNIVSALLMDKVGRLSMLGGSMVLSGISCFFLWFGTSESMMIAMLCLYNGLSISAWNSLDVVTAEIYPTNRRGTGFGFCNALCKLAAVLGNLIFGSLVGITKAVPILLASSVLVAGGLVGLRLPDTRSNVLM